jgi:response regulator RpfG family c-di-GMP phosphodiesterase/serine/threonine protein kinase
MKQSPSSDLPSQSTPTRHDRPGESRKRAGGSAYPARASAGRSRVLLQPLQADIATFLAKLLELPLLEPTALEQFLEARKDRLGEYRTARDMGQALVQARLLTAYQLERVLTATTHGLVLGSYRVLEALGNGGMGVVFLAEHCLMKRRVAIKVLPVDEDCPTAVRERFYGEMRVLAELSHPNVILAFDAGEIHSQDKALPDLIYLVMEVVDGGDLEKHVMSQGPCSVNDACDFVRQAACGLQAAHDRHLIHRDVKPSNLLLTSTNQVKLVDFGLARQFCSQLTDPRSLLGSIEFMAPEQSHDPSSVGKAADIYGLGATLFWLLTGEPPYPFTRFIGAALRALQHQPPRRLRALRPDMPQELDELVARMMERNPARRPSSPLSVAMSLMRFASQEPIRLAENEKESPARNGQPGEQVRPWRVLVVDDDDAVRTIHEQILGCMGCECTQAGDGATTLAMAARQPFDLVLLDLKLPDMDGFEVCRRLRDQVACSTLKVIMVSGQGDQNDLAECLPRGADDYIVKPFETRQMIAKVGHVLRLKEAQDRAGRLSEQLLITNQQLQRSLDARLADVRQAHDALLFTMAKMAESRDGETAGHLQRLQAYSGVLARRAAQAPPWSGLIDERFLAELERCVPLHDIGKIGMPDEVLLKPASLNPAERALIETHPVIGDHLLEALGREHGASLEFLGMARAIVRHHHERYDGRGYPDRLAGDAIPAAARIVAIADVYDALRRERLHKQAMSHGEALRILQSSRGQFDPTLLAALADCEQDFDRIYRDISE